MREAEQLLKEDIDRYLRLKENPKDIKAPGVTRKLLRKIRRVSKQLNIACDL